MIIYPELTITWAGEEYQVKADFELINKIEQTVNLGALSNRLNRGDVPLTHIAFLYSMFLKKAGCRVSGDEVFAAILGQTEDENDIDQELLIGLAAQCLNACFPVVQTKQKKSTKNQKAKTKA